MKKGVDSTMEYMTSMTRLERLKLQGSDMSEQGIKAIAENCPNLLSLDLLGTTLLASDRTYLRDVLLFLHPHPQPRALLRCLVSEFGKELTCCE